MATSIYKKRFLENRKANGLCIDCGNKLDRDGVRCVKCNEKHNEETNCERKWYKDNGICPRCRKNTLFGDENMCPECSASMYITNLRTKERLGKEHCNYMHKEWAKKEYKRRSENGICTRCGKRNAMVPYKMCGICIEKDRKRKRIKYKESDRSDRYKQGLCYFCDNQVKDGYKVCEKHYQMNVEKANSRKAKDVRTELINNKILY